MTELIIGLIAVILPILTRALSNKVIAELREENLELKQELYDLKSKALEVESEVGKHVCESR